MLWIFSHNPRKIPTSFFFFSKVAGRIFLRINSGQHFNVGSTLLRNCGSPLKLRWSDVENEIKSKVEFSTLHNIDPMLVSNIETTLNQRCTTSMQPFSNVAQSLFNVVSAWPQRQLKLSSNQSGYWKVWICRKTDKFYSTKWEIILCNTLTINKSLK